MRYLVLGAVLTLMLDCRCDPPPGVEPPPSISGSYHGTYSVAVAGRPAEVVDVVWTFESKEYVMSVDTLGQNVTQICCNCSGRYILGNNIELVQTDPNVDSQICSTDANPEGIFAVDQSQPGRLLFRQVRDSVTFSIELFGPE